MGSEISKRSSRLAFHWAIIARRCSRSTRFVVGSSPGGAARVDEEVEFGTFPVPEGPEPPAEPFISTFPLGAEDAVAAGAPDAAAPVLVLVLCSMLSH